MAKLQMFQRISVILILIGLQEVIAKCGLIPRSVIYNHASTFIDYVNESTSIGSKAKFVCIRGAQLVDEIDENVECTSTGWTIPYGVLVRCELIACNPDPRDLVIQNGYVHHEKEYWTFQFALGSAYSVACDPGYEVFGSPLRICTDKGKWSGKPPVCSRIKHECPEPKNLINGKLQKITNLDILKHFLNKTVYTVVCDTGFCVTRGSSMVICGADGQWELEIPMCESIQIDCHEPHPIQNGYIEPHKDGGKYDYYIVECEHGFMINGRRDRKCINGKWSGTMPSCEPILSECLPFTIPNGRIEISAQTEKTCAYIYYSVECEDGYRLNGSRILRCHRNNTWMFPKTIPQCVIIPISDDHDPWFNYFIVLVVLFIIVIISMGIVCVVCEANIYRSLDNRQKRRDAQNDFERNKLNHDKRNDFEINKLNQDAQKLNQDAQNDFGGNKLNRYTLNDIDLGELNMDAHIDIESNTLNARSTSVSELGVSQRPDSGGSELVAAPGSYSNVNIAESVTHGPQTMAPSGRTIQPLSDEREYRSLP